MRKIHILGILALLVLTTSIASASITVPVNVYKSDQNDPIPPNTAITATFSGNSVTVQAVPTNGAQSLPTNFDIKTIDIYTTNLPITLTSFTAPNGETWTQSQQTNVPNMFGQMTVECNGENDQQHKNGGPITLTFNKQLEPPTENTNGFFIVLHIGWEDNGDKSNYVGNGSNNHNIPEFPSVVLPVAAILGIMIIFGRRKKE